MDTAILIFEILLLVAGVFLVGAVLMQHGKSHGLSGAIAGGAETFFGKEKGKRYDRLISRWTTIIGAIFVVIVLIVYILMPDVKQSIVNSADYWGISPYNSTTVTEIVEED
jgi:preprotein translocase subunit SecG